MADEEKTAACDVVRNNTLAGLREVQEYAKEKRKLLLDHLLQNQPLELGSSGETEEIKDINRTLDLLFFCFNKCMRPGYAVAESVDSNKKTTEIDASLLVDPIVWHILAHTIIVSMMVNIRERESLVNIIANHTGTEISFEVCPWQTSMVLMTITKKY